MEGGLISGSFAENLAQAGFDLAPEYVAPRERILGSLRKWNLATIDIGIQEWIGQKKLVEIYNALDIHNVTFSNMREAIEIVAFRQLVYAYIENVAVEDWYFYNINKTEKTLLKFAFATRPDLLHIGLERRHSMCCGIGQCVLTPYSYCLVYNCPNLIGGNTIYTYVRTQEGLNLKIGNDSLRIENYRCPIVDGIENRTIMNLEYLSLLNLKQPIQGWDEYLLQDHSTLLDANLLTKCSLSLLGKVSSSAGFQNYIIGRRAEMLKDFASVYAAFPIEMERITREHLAYGWTRHHTEAISLIEQAVTADKQAGYYNAIYAQLANDNVQWRLRWLALKRKAVLVANAIRAITGKSRWEHWVGLAAGAGVARFLNAHCPIVQGAISTVWSYLSHSVKNVSGIATAASVIGVGIGVARWFRARHAGSIVYNQALDDTNKPRFELIERENSWVGTIVSKIHPMHRLERAVGPEVACDPLMKITGTMNESEVAPINYAYPLYNTNVPAYAFTRSPATKADAVKVRLLKPAPLDPLIQLQRWEEAAFTKEIGDVKVDDAPFWEMFDVMDENDPELRRKWEEHLTPEKRMRYQLAAKKFAFHTVAEGQYRIEVFPKTDEALIRVHEEIKPRIICNVPPQVQYYTGPCIYAATERLHEMWSIPPKKTEIFGIQVYISFGSGATDVQLDQWREWVEDNPDKTAIIVAGDDSVVHYDGVWYCSDYSSFDQSQSFGPLRAERMMLKGLGVPPSIYKIIYDSASKPFVMFERHKNLQHEKVTIMHESRPMRMTGGPDTTIGNSIIAALSWAWVISTTMITPEQFLHLGLKVKLNQVAEGEISFLKGYWLRGKASRYYWTPCLARLIKYGKTLKDPRTITKISDYKLASSEYLNALAMSVQQYYYCPLYREFIDRWLNNPRSKNTAVAYIANKTRYKIQSAIRVVEEDKYYPFSQQLADIYSISEEQLMQMGNLLSQTQIGAHLYHPGFTQIATVDYDP